MVLGFRVEALGYIGLGFKDLDSRVYGVNVLGLGFRVYCFRV